RRRRISRRDLWLPSPSTGDGFQSSADAVIPATAYGTRKSKHLARNDRGQAIREGRTSGAHGCPSEAIMGTPGNTNYPFLGGDPTSTYPRDWTLQIGGVPCGIFLDEGDAVTESNQETGRAATVILQCYWNQRQQAIAGLLG